MLDFYKGKKIFITGHTGFKGAWLCYILVKAGAIVKGYSLEPPTTPSLFEIIHFKESVQTIIGDIRDFEHLKKEFEEFRPDIVFHLAAQPLVREGYNKPHYTFDVNVMGTVNILECLRLCDSVKSFINVTTDKVYENNDLFDHVFSENDKLDGYDPYSNSKSCSEIITHSYKKSFLNNISVSTVRAGNVIGGGDFSKDRIIPDCVKAIMNNESIIIRNPHSVRPYQHVLEPLFAYLMIAQKQYEDPTFEGWYNVGPSEDVINTYHLVELFVFYYGNNIKWINQNENGPHEASCLKLDVSKIKKTFGWKPTWNIETAIRKTVEWYKCYINGENIEKLMDRQIEDFINEME